MINQGLAVSNHVSDRLIALDVRPRSFGFIVLEGLMVLDCGNRWCNKADSNDCLGQRLLRILEIYQPSTVAMRSHIPRSANNRSRNNVDTLRTVTERFGVQSVWIAPDTVRDYFRQHDAHTKFEIAQAVVSFLPDLAWKLPPQRKVWQSEHHRMSIFDAAAIALAHLEPQSERPASFA